MNRRCETVKAIQTLRGQQREIVDVLLEDLDGYTAQALSEAITALGAPVGAGPVSDHFYDDCCDCAA